MNEMIRGAIEIALAIVSVATLTVLVRNTSQTAQVIQAASSGFSQALSTAMGGTSGSEFSSSFKGF